MRDKIVDKILASVLSVFVLSLVLGLASHVTKVKAQLSTTHVTGVLNTTCSSATANCTTANADAEISTGNYGTVLATLNGTYGSATIFLEGTDNSLLWYAVACVEAKDGTTVENTKTLVDNTAYAWQCPVSGFVRFRIRASAISTGAANVGLTTSTATGAPIVP